MERQWSGNARRLSRADRAQIESLIWGGATFAATADVVGCSTKSIQRFLVLTGGLKEPAQTAFAPAFVACGARGAIAGSGGW